MKLRISLVLVAISLLWIIPTAHVAAVEMIPLPLELPNVIGGAVGFYPDYEGSDDYAFGALPALSLQFDRRYLRLYGNYLQVNVINDSHLAFGPSAMYRFGRDDDVDDDLVKEMEEIDDSVELGAFISYALYDPSNPRIRASATFEVLADVSDGHDGYVAQLSVRGFYPLAMMLDAGLAVGGTYASEDYTDTFFGVSSQDAERTGLPVYDADAGAKDVYLQPMLMAHLSRDWHVVLGIRYKRLLGDASDSPIVDDRGSEDQLLGGLGLVYSW